MSSTLGGVDLRKGKDLFLRKGKSGAPQVTRENVKTPNKAWLDSSLRRSASLGLEVLERASRRSVDRTSSGSSQTSSHNEEKEEIPTRGNQSELNEAFTAIAEFMALTSRHCRRFYGSGYRPEPSEAEKRHMCRFHTRPIAGRNLSALPTKNQLTKKRQASSTQEDFYIEVYPGTYAVTASLAESQRQTHLVNVRAGESVDLTFNL